MDPKLLREQLNKIPPERYEDLIKRIAFKRKKHVYENAKYQCKDEHQLDHIDQMLESGTRFFQTQSDVLNQRHDINQKKSRELRQNIDEITNQIQQLQAEIKRDEDISKMKRELDELVGKMNANQIKKLNLIFQAGAPTKLVNAFQSLVAVLRNHTSATNVDVELYLQDFTKFQLKLIRIEPASLNVDVVKKGLTQLKQAHEKLTDVQSADYKRDQEFVIYIKWGLDFCEYASKVLILVDKQKKIYKLNDEKEKLDTQVLLIASIEYEYQKEDIFKWTQDQMKEINARSQLYQTIRETDHKQAEKFRDEYKTFETIYFREFEKLQDELKEPKESKKMPNPFPQGKQKLAR